LKADISKLKAISRALNLGRTSFKALYLAEKTTKDNLSSSILKVANMLLKLSQSSDIKKAHLLMIESYTLLMKSKGYLSAIKEKRGDLVSIDRAYLREMLTIDEDVALKIAEMKDLIQKGSSYREITDLAESIYKLIKKRGVGRKIKRAEKARGF